MDYWFAASTLLASGICTPICRKRFDVSVETVWFPLSTLPCGPSV